MPRPGQWCFSILFLFLLVSTREQKLLGQFSDRIGIEIQAYPTGVIPGIRYEHVLSTSSYFTARIGYQIIRHRDLGKHDDERGSGYGFSLGYKTSITSKLDFGIRSDLWWNDIDWTDRRNGQEVTGNTSITVLQPTARIEYVIDLGSFYLVPSIGFGMEWNIKTSGEPTGEGLIGLVGLLFSTNL